MDEEPTTLSDDEIKDGGSTTAAESDADGQDETDADGADTGDSDGTDTDDSSGDADSTEPS